MERPGLADQKDLARWADSVASQSEFPRLIRRLILETGKGVVHLGVPAGEGVASGDWDGTVRATEATAFLPKGLSLWEMSVNKNVGAKADSDFEKRTSTPDGSPTTEASYVAAYLRRWGKRDEWARDRNSGGRWKEVKAYGIDAIETWLEAAPVTHAWISEKLGLHPFGLRPADSWWAIWSSRTTPSMTIDLVTAGRSKQTAQLVEALADTSSPRLITIKGASMQETQAFIATVGLEAERRGQAHVLPRIAFVDEVAAWRALEDQSNPLILVPSAEAVIAEAGASSRHHVVVPVTSATPADIELPPLDEEEATAALKAAGLRDDRRAQEAGRLARRSLTALRRRLANKPELHEPNWAKAPVPRQVRALLFAGLWKDANESDRAVVSDLAEGPYELLREELAPLASRDDPFLVRVGDSWSLVSPFDAWLLLRGQLVKEDMDRLKEAVDKVLSEDDPALELPLEERWMASIYGKVRKYSADLRQGLSRTLALLAVQGSHVDAGGSGSEWASYIDRTVLEGATKDTTGTRWASVSDVLPLLAEASPDRFAEAVRSGVTGDAPVLRLMFLDRKDADSFTTSSPHTGLLWALEALAWSDEHFGQAIDLLARLDALDPGGKLSNRPFESIANIYCPWHPETNAGINSRLTVLDGLRKRHADLSWRLMISMLPESDAIHMPTYEPQYRDWKLDRQPVTTAEYVNLLAEVVTRLISDADADAGRWDEFLQKSSQLPPNDRVRVYDALEDVVSAAVDNAQLRSSLWQTLRRITSEHTEFTDADWALPTGEVERLKGLMERLSPSSAFVEQSWLFADHMPNIVDVKRRDDLEAFETELTSRRHDAVAAIEGEGGIDAVKRLARESVVPWAVGVALADATQDRHAAELLPALDGEERAEHALAHAYFARLFASLGWDWLDGLLRQESVTATQRARLLWASRDFPRAWERADEDGDDVARGFWTNFSNVGHGADFPHVAYCAERLMSVGRYASALDLMAMYLGRGTEEQPLVPLIEQALTGLLEHEDPEARQLRQWDFEQLFSLLERHKQVVGDARLASLEWAYLPALGHEPDVPALHGAMANDPSFFVEIVKTVYRPRARDDNGTGEEPSENRKRLAANGYELLSSWSRVPGLAEDGTLDAAALQEWTREVVRLLEEADRLEVGLLHVGRMLASSPPDSDGNWPGEAVRDLLEELQSEQLEEGLRTEILNRRGVTSRAPGDGGTQEARLAEKHAAEARAVGDKSPRAAAILRAVASAYESEARREDQHAEKFRTGLDH
jgi:hypothetical protein